MLDAYIIEKIKQRHRIEEQPQLEIPEESDRKPESVDEESHNVIIIDYGPELDSIEQ